VLDVMMPKFSGLEVLRFLHSQEALKEVRIIILSNISFGGEERKTAATEADKILLKSVCTPAVLLAAVNEVLAATNKAAFESPDPLADDVKL